MSGGNSSEEESYDDKGDKDYEASASSDDDDDNGDGEVSAKVNKGKSTMVTRSRKRDKPSSQVITIPESVKTRARSSGIQISEAPDLLAILGPSWGAKKEPPDLLAILGPSWGAKKDKSGIICAPNQRNEPSSSQQANISPASLPVVISPPSQVVTSSEPSSTVIARSNFQDSSIFRPSSSSSRVEAQAQANITSSRPLPLPAMPNYLRQQQHPFPLSSTVFDFSRMIPPRPSAYDVRVPNHQGIPNTKPSVTGYNLDELGTISRLCWFSNLYAPNVVPGTTLAPSTSSFEGNIITSPSTSNPHCPSVVSGRLPSPALSNVSGRLPSPALSNVSERLPSPALSNVSGRLPSPALSNVSGPSSVEAQDNVTRPAGTSGNSFDLNKPAQED